MDKDIFSKAKKQGKGGGWEWQISSKSTAYRSWVRTLFMSIQQQLIRIRTNEHFRVKRVPGLQYIESNRCIKIGQNIKDNRYVLSNSFYQERLVE